MPTKTGSTVHIGLLYHSLNSENLGVGAFTVANIALLGEAVERHGGSPVFHIIGARGGKDYTDTSPWPVDFTNVGLKSLLKPWSDLHRTMKRCDAFFDIAGGDSFTDIYGPKRFSLIVGARLLASTKDKPFVMSPQTIGPFSSAWGRLGAKMALERADRIFARDAMSFAALEQFGMERKSQLTTDLAFLLPFDSTPKKSSEQYSRGDWDVGLNVSGLLFRNAGNADGRIRLKLDYASFTRKLIEKILADPRTGRLHLIPHVLAPALPGDDDGAVADLLKREYPELIIAPDFHSPSAAKSYIATMDLLLGARMHATIAAVSSDTAVLPLAYSRKFNGLYGSLNYPYLVDMVNEDETAALERLTQVMDDLPAIAEASANSNALAREQLRTYTDFIDRFAADLVQS